VILDDVGIVIPNLNYARYLPDCIESILKLKTLPQQVTFVDDCSTDDSFGVWKGLKPILNEASIITKWIRRKVNGGTGAALNSGIVVTPTEWILPLASDDKIMPHALDHLFERAGNTYDVVNFGYEGFGVASNGKPLGSFRRMYPRHEYDLVKNFLSGKRLSTGCSPFRRYLWERSPFNEAFRTAEDTAFWIMAARLGARFTNSTVPCIWVRYHLKRKSFSKIKTKSQKRQMLEAHCIKNKLPKVDFYATEQHFIDHLASIYHAMPSEVKGVFYVSPATNAHARTLGVNPVVVSQNQLRANRRLTVVSADGNQRKAAQAGRQTVLCEHGSGQSYTGTRRHPSYAGYTRRQRMALFMMPGPHGANLNRNAMPGVPVVEIGCPKLDPWITGEKSFVLAERPIVVISFHWEAKVVPETRSAWSHYQGSLITLRDELARQGIDLHGHAHPRFQKTAYPAYHRMGISILHRFEEVLDKASLYIVDNSSTLFEFAATGRPVVVLNCPQYRRNVHHGLRFWDAATVGIQVDHPKDLFQAIMTSMEDPQWLQEQRVEALRKVYTYIDGKSSRRAATALVHVARTMKQPAPMHRRSTLATYRTSNVKYIYLRGLSTFANKAYVDAVWDGRMWASPLRGQVRVGQYFRCLNDKVRRQWITQLSSKSLAVTSRSPEPVQKVPVPVVAKAAAPVVEKPGSPVTPVTEDASASNGVVEIKKKRGGGYYDLTNGDVVRGKGNVKDQLMLLNDWTETQALVHINES